MKRFSLTIFFTVFFVNALAAQQGGAYYFSPGTDSEKKMLVVPFSINDSRFIKSWHFIITDSSGKAVRTNIGEELPAIAERPDNWREILSAFFKPKHSVNVPRFVVWDGKNDSDVKCPDGTYFFYFSSTDDNDNYSETTRYRVVLDTVRPSVNITQPSAQAKIFGDPSKPTLAIQETGTREDLWTAEIKNEAGKIIRSYTWRDAPPQNVNWDGKNDQGLTQEDGTYSYSISAIDAAGNKSLPAGVTGITLESIVPAAEVGRSVSELAPNGKTRRQVFAIQTNLKTGIESWSFTVVNASDGTGAVREWTRSGSLPSQLDWDGKLANGTIAEGVFKGVLKIKYSSGNVVTGETPSFICTGLAPVISANPTPKLFSPDGDGENDILNLGLSAKSLLPIADWSFTISDPTDKTFKIWTGKSEVPPRLDWNGRGDNGDLVESAMDYPYTFTVSDTQGQVSTTSGVIPIDVLVLREGDRLILRVPAIIFRANNADFKSKKEDARRGLEQSVIDNNDKILKRIAEILQKFSAYSVKVEGHANSETGTEKEEVEQLEPLSKSRADFVKEKLIELGVSASRLTTEGVGGRRPVMKNRKDRDNWWKNRRVEFVLKR
ncbi:MAG: OmpA family protein [Spirochaetaceae bacterium]|jgi:outer membrane protein OmpA-like peptidoglycan-associated protein/flagellar hook assembly protein FlgD|nr:OmpA family protein [Spirochaetaceae bacterium]